MKKMALLSSLILSTTSMAGELPNYNAIKTSVLSGKSIHIVIDFSKCSTSAKNIADSTSVGIFSPSSIAITDHIATSLTHFTLNDPSFPARPVYEFVRYVITDDNHVNLTTQVLDAVNYGPISDKISFNCPLETAAKVYD